MDRGRAFDRLRHHLEGGPAAGIARERPAIDAEIEEFLHPGRVEHRDARSEEHTSELQSLMRNSYAVFCLKKKTTDTTGRRHKKQSTSQTHNVQKERTVH